MSPDPHSDAAAEWSDEIARLRLENAVLRAALAPFATEAGYRSWVGNAATGGDNIGASGLTNADLRRAVVALGRSDTR